MALVQIQQLLRPPSQQISEERTLALINGTFTTVEQLNQSNALDELIHDSLSSTEDLNSKLTVSNEHVERLILETREEAQARLTSAQELSLLRHSLADELTNLSEQLVSTARDQGGQSTLLEEVEALHRSLKELESVKSYVLVIERALKLSDQAVRPTATSPISEASVTEYKALQDFVASVRDTCSNVEDGAGQGIKLVNFLETIQEKTWSDIKGSLFSTLLNAAEKLHWPMPVDYATAPLEVRKSFESAFISLLKLQDIGEKLHGRSERKQSPRDGLYPIQALVQPVSLRFKYHFEGSRQTNRLDKPEWYFAHILNVSHDHRSFMDNTVQQLLQSSEHKSINAWREFTRLLLPILSRKIRHSVPSLLPHPSLLAHTVYQSLSFDSSLREAGFGIAATSEEKRDAGLSEDDWEGTSEMLLGKKEWFDAWLEGERKFAEDQYNDIISSPNAWQLTDDGSDESNGNHELRPTNSARRIKILIEQITDRYRPLPRFLHRTRFLIAVQVPILELYHTRISESLDAFETLSSFLVRAVPGALAGQTGSHLDTKRMTSGVEGVQRLVKAFVSAKWVSGAMVTWGEDLFFLELWTTICERASLRGRVESNPSLPNPNGANDEGTIFEELVDQYTKLAERAENMIIRQVTGEIEADLKTHFYRRSEVPSTEDRSDGLGISATLAAPIARLSSHLALLRDTLPHPLVVNMYRRIASPIATHILQRGILYRGRGYMHACDGKILLDECNIWLGACRMALGRSVRRVEGPWEKLLECARLLALDSDIFQRVVASTFIGGDQEYDSLMEEVGVGELSRDEVADVLRVREDCGRN